MKVIVIGATGTIGAAVADALAPRHEVVRASRNGDVRVDALDAASVQALFDRVEAVDALVHCAGDAMAARGPLQDLRDAQLDVVTGLLKAQVRLVQIASKRLRDGGSIVLTSGMLATRPRAGASLLTTMGAALEAFVRAAALELPRGLRINCISPGWVKETMEKHGLDAGSAMPAATLARYYASAVEGTMNGTVIDAAP